MGEGHGIGDGLLDEALRSVLRLVRISREYDVPYLNGSSNEEQQRGGRRRWAR